MEKDIGIGLLNDYYGALLTEYQSEIIRLYYDMDLSLQEIAEQYGITRQGVREVIVRTSKKLEDYEKKLGLLSKLNSVTAALEEALENGRPLGKIDIEKILEKVRSI